MPDPILAGLLWLLFVAFVGAGIANLAGLGTVRADFARWGYPSGSRQVTGLAELIGAALLLNTHARLAGLALLIAIMAGATGTLLHHREGPAHLLPAILLTGLLMIYAAAII